MCSEFGLEWNNEGILGNKVEPGAESLTGPALVDYVNKKQNLWKVNFQRFKMMLVEEVTIFCTVHECHDQSRVLQRHDEAASLDPFERLHLFEGITMGWHYQKV